MPRLPIGKKAEVKHTAYPKSSQPPLDAALYARLVEKVRSSKSEKESDLAFEQIANGLKPRIRNLCSKFTIPGLGPDDILQEAMIALRFRAIKDYDQTKGTGEGPAPFDRFALLCIRRYLSTEYKASRQQRRRVLNTCISLDQDRSENHDDLSLANIAHHTKGDVLDFVEKKDYFNRFIRKLLQELSDFEKEVFLLYVEKYSYEEIADRINRKRPDGRFSKKSVDNGLSRVKAKSRLILTQKPFRISEDDE